MEVAIELSDKNGQATATRRDFLRIAAMVGFGATTGGVPGLS